VAMETHPMASKATVQRHMIVAMSVVKNRALRRFAFLHSAVQTVVNEVLIQFALAFAV
jgi:hypothetical protein